jgi:hypothetical protein
MLRHESGRNFLERIAPKVANATPKKSEDATNDSNAAQSCNNNNSSNSAVATNAPQCEGEHCSIGAKGKRDVEKTSE